jgi:nucleoid DNA-binding protein
MNTIDILTKVADDNKISTGRAEMILSIIIEKITDKLRKDREVKICDFGTFTIYNKNTGTTGFGAQKKQSRNYVLFTPDKPFKDVINL